MSIMESMERERRPRRSFSKEFKRDAVALVRSSGKTIAESYNQNLWIDHPFEGAVYLPR
jgi:hypothetical protein